MAQYEKAIGVTEFVHELIMSHPDKVWDIPAVRKLVAERFPNSDPTTATWTLRGLANRNRVRRVGRGRYTSPKNTALPKYRIRRNGIYTKQRVERVVVREQLPPHSEDDALNNALDALVTVERVLRKHIEMRKKLRELGGVLNDIT